ncbi:hypothetical protein B0181_00225 [Moraxella caviae]|uniref:AlgX/AlgJ SGNH hydrolase-like domain-containing protein n=1 Tax=Moraxella caviae TaxID=34060 RepID=A0A1T0ACS4_9GAMM|nr:DHHW family protein [Moraxella caviae]OOR93516.1 hypothetical protein B0181_00225 [Moraxella caviae]STZ10340.1 Uncharacterised protein [Moraxella caviae]VEW10430.1 Uncharacterised protein [Moraxella caviae]
MKNIIMILNSMLFIVALVVGGIAFWFMPQQTISEDENRELAPKPVATKDSVLSGEYEKSFEEYYNDHFPYRNLWIGFANHINTIKGIKSQEFRVIEPATPPASHSTTTQNAATDEAVNKEQDPLDFEVDDAEFNRIKGVIVVDGRVVQNFGGSKATVSPYADMLNTYRNTLDASVRMYAMMIPSGSDFYLPKQVNDGIKKEWENIQIFNSLLDLGILPVPAYEEMLPHRDEYIAFRTDHHWTGLGAYYAYRAMARTAGFTPVELDQMQIVKQEKSFMGSLYNYTRDQELKKNPDFLEYYKLPNHDDISVTINTKKMDHNNADAGSPWVLFAESSNSYGAFLGGDYPLLRIKTKNTSGRKIIVVKDSFGNALAPYLAAHYDEIYVIDYRHFKGSLPKLIQDYQVTDLLFAFNTFAANSNSVVKFGTAMLNR